MNTSSLPRQAFALTVLGAAFGHLAYVVTGYTSSLTDWCLSLPIYFIGAFLGYRGLRVKGVLFVVAALFLIYFTYVFGNRTLGLPYNRAVDMLLRQVAAAWILIPQTVLGYVAILGAAEWWHGRSRTAQS